MSAFLRGVICTGDRVSNLITEEEDYLCDREFGAEPEGRVTTTGVYFQQMWAAF